MGPRSFILPLTPHRCRRRCSSVHILLSTLKGCRGKWLSIRVKHVAVIVVAKQQHSHSTELSVTLVKMLKLVEFRGKHSSLIFRKIKKDVSLRGFFVLDIQVCWFCILFFGRLNIIYFTTLFVTLHTTFSFTQGHNQSSDHWNLELLVKLQPFIWGHTNWTTLGYAVVQSRVSASQHVEGWIEKVTGTREMTNTAWNVTPYNFQIFWESYIIESIASNCLNRFYIVQMIKVPPWAVTKS